jgi:hypothetical protein
VAYSGFGWIGFGFKRDLAAMAFAIDFHLYAPPVGFEPEHTANWSGRYPVQPPPLSRVPFAAT